MAVAVLLAALALPSVVMLMPPATTEPRRKAPMVALRMGVMVICFLLGRFDVRTQRSSECGTKVRPTRKPADESVRTKTC